MALLFIGLGHSHTGLEAVLGHVGPLEAGLLMLLPLVLFLLVRCLLPKGHVLHPL